MKAEVLGRTPRASPVPVSASKTPFLKTFSRPLTMLVLPMVLALFTPLRLAKMLGGRLTTAVLGSITAACTVLTVRMVRWHMDTFWSWYQEKKWLPNNANYAQDGAPVMEGVKDIRLEKFGPRPRETCHILTPTKPSGRALMYVHGGGFVVANSTVLLHSITLFCRQGLTVYSLDYPHAPEHRFPEPLISVLRGLSWLYTTHNVQRVSLFGDSAGANLCTMAAALVCNPALLASFARETKSLSILDWPFPAIDAQISLYGVLDQQSWRDCQLNTVCRAENAIALAGLRTCMSLYRSQHGVFENRFTLLDVAAELQAYPRTLIIGASKDLLVCSSSAAYTALRRRGFDVHLRMFDARHGFFGFPPSWTFGAWKTSAQPASTLMTAFLRDTSPLVTPVARPAAHPSTTTEHAPEDTDTAVESTAAERRADDTAASITSSTETRHHQHTTATAAAAAAATKSAAAWAPLQPSWRCVMLDDGPACCIDVPAASS